MQAAAEALVSLGEDKDEDEERRQSDFINLDDVSQTIPRESLGEWSFGPVRIVEDVSLRGGDALLLFEAAHAEWAKKLADASFAGMPFICRHKAVRGIKNFTANFPEYLARALTLYEDGGHLMRDSPLKSFTLSVATAVAGGRDVPGERYYVRSQGS